MSLYSLGTRVQTSPIYNEDSQLQSNDNLSHMRVTIKLTEFITHSGRFIMVWLNPISLSNKIDMTMYNLT